MEQELLQNKHPDISARLEKSVSEVALLAVESRKIINSDEIYLRDDVMGQIETYLSTGITKLKEETSKDGLPAEKQDDLLQYCDYLKYQFQLLRIRKKLIDGDMSEPMPISNIDDTESLQGVFNGHDQKGIIGVGLTPKNIRLPSSAGSMEWKNSAGFGMTLVQALPEHTLVESAGPLSETTQKNIVLYGENNLDAFFASLLMKGLVPADDHVKELLIRTVKYARGEPDHVPDEVKKLKEAGVNRDVKAILGILGSKKKIGEILRELENLDTNVKARLFYSHMVKETGLDNISEQDLHHMVYSNKAVLERIAISLFLENEVGSAYEDMILHLLVSGSGDQNVKWKAGMILSKRVPLDENNYLKVIKFAKAAFRKNQRNAWYFALNIAHTGLYSELNEILRDMFVNHKADPEFEAVIINNAENILGPDWRNILSSHESSDADVQVILNVKLTGKKEKPDTLEIDLNNESKDRFKGALFGHAIGDAMGAPIEMLKLAQIKDLYGVVSDFVQYEYQTLPPGDHTDDTALTLIGMDSIMEKRGFDPDDYAKRLAHLSLAMDYGKEPDRHFGGGSMMAMRRLAIGQDRIFSGNGTGKNGSAIRMIPFAFLDMFDNKKRLRKNVDAASFPTHNDDLAREGAYMSALAIRNCLEPKKIDSDGFIKKLVSECRNDALKKKIALVQQMLSENKPIEEVQKTLGTSSRVTDTIPYALYCFLKNPYNFRDVITAALNIDGDSDSIAAIAGSLCGAFIGYKKIPPELADKLQCKNKLMQYFSG
jgi:ADP-ribosylglycohydrolase